MLRGTLAIVLVVLIVSACCNSREATVSRESRYGIATYETKDSVGERLVMVHDTITETKTITHVLRQAQEPNEPADTVFTSVVTDRTRAASRDHFAAYKTKTVIKTDTVFVERRDSVLVKNTNQARASPFENTLKWVFFIVLALIGLILLLRIRR